MKYIGYSRLEKLIERVDDDHTLYLIGVEEVITGEDGIGLFRSELIVQASFLESIDEPIFYWRMIIGETLAPGGEPWPDEASKIRTAAKSALEIVKEYLAVNAKVKRIEEGALIAMPRELKLLRGQAGCLQFDRDSGTYRLKEVIHEKTIG